ncbi:hypothetical protein BDN71DRAFT_1432260 [Pleurotus eryngii]|uniref:Uncharacterized protein n=1 Tax=Pleurotus eryngii TaxID=5323 RepID=A0A9P6DFK0_PLEER|nr:hypothetical protein BDN71DRAFT_1432260 [Pleurotus eryngii]
MSILQLPTLEMSIPRSQPCIWREQLAEQEHCEDIKVQMRLYKRKQADQDMILEVLRKMSMLSAERPCCRNAMNIYWAENYAQHLRKDFKVIWNKAKGTASPNACISMCTAYVTARYAAKTPVFRKELEERADRDPKALHQVWEDADNFLHVFVDVISKKFGMSMSLLLVGPLGVEQGKISIVHSSNPGSMTNLIGPEFDKEGFSNMQVSLIKYGHSVVCSFYLAPAECKRHIISDGLAPEASSNEGLLMSPLLSSQPASITITEEPGERLSDSDKPSL